MTVEIERKFLFSELPPGVTDCKSIQQAYLQPHPDRSVRVRITTLAHGQSMAHLSVKGPLSGAFSRHEFEYEIPVVDAEALLAICDHPPIMKKRYIFPHENHCWELDVFAGANAGLMVAEVELQSEQEPLILPPFVRTEVTGDKRYFNLALAYKPFTTW